MLPDHWEMVTLAEVADYRAGRTPARANTSFWEGEDATLPWVSIADMTEHQVVRDTKEKITQKAADVAFRGGVSHAGTLLMSFKLTIGRVATLGIDAFHNEAIISIFPRKGMDQRFLGYWLSQVDYDRLHDRQIKGNTLNQEKIDRIPVARPPEEEQANIADVLDAVHGSVLIQIESLATAVALKRATMRELFKSGIRGEARRESDIGRIPVSWATKRLESTAEIISSRMTYSELEGLIDADGVKVLGIKVGDMNREGNEVILGQAALERMVPVAVAQNRCVPPGTIVFPKRGAAIATNKKRITTEWSVFDPNVIGVIAKGKLKQRFLFHWFQSFDLRTITEPGPTPQLNKKNLEPLLIPVPSTSEEQDEIVAILDAIDAKIDLHKRKKAALEELFRAMLQKLMAGEIRVADLDLTALDASNQVAA